MKIPVLIHKDESSVHGVTVPDIPGRHSWGETIDHAMRNVRDAIYSHVKTLQDLGKSAAIVPSQIEQLSKDVEYAGGVWALVDIDPARLNSKPWVSPPLAHWPSCRRAPTRTRNGRARRPAPG